MNSLGKIGGKLALICAAAALTLGAVNAVTAPIITERRIAELNEAISALAGEGRVGAEHLVEDDAIVQAYFPVQDAQGRTSGYVLRLIGFGYGGDMVILAGISASGEIRAVRLLDNQETPGLGKKAESPEYLRKFQGFGAERPVPVRRSQLTDEQAEAVTGATITFTAIGRALEAGSAYVRGLGGRP